MLNAAGEVLCGEKWGGGLNQDHGFKCGALSKFNHGGFSAGGIGRGVGMAAVQAEFGQGRIHGGGGDSLIVGTEDDLINFRTV